MPSEEHPPRAASSADLRASVRVAVALGYGVLCHGLYVAAVGTMIGMMYFGMSRSLGTLDGAAGWAANLALLLQFPLTHSLLLTERGRAWLGRLAPRRLGPALATTSYAAISASQVLLLFALWSPTGIIWWQAEGPVRLLVTALYALTWLLLARSMVDAGLSLQIGHLGWWAVLRGRAPRFPPMPTGGLFRLVRQPIYVAFALTLWTVPTWTPDQLVVATLLTGYCLVGPRFKEARFRRFFGPAFDAYARRVPYWLPWPRPPKPPKEAAVHHAE